MDKYIIKLVQYFKDQYSMMVRDLGSVFGLAYISGSAVLLTNVS